MTPMERTEHYLAQYPAAPSSPGPFVVLLMYSHRSLQSCGAGAQWKTGRTPKMGKNGRNKSLENCPRAEMGQKWLKNTRQWKIGPMSIFWVFFGHFFAWRVFHCVPAPHDCKPNLIPPKHVGYVLASRVCVCVCVCVCSHYSHTQGGQGANMSFKKNSSKIFSYIHMILIFLHVLPFFSKSLHF